MLCLKFCSNVAYGWPSEFQLRQIPCTAYTSAHEQLHNRPNRVKLSLGVKLSLETFLVSLDPPNHQPPLISFLNRRFYTLHCGGTAVNFYLNNKLYFSNFRTEKNDHENERAAPSDWIPTDHSKYHTDLNMFSIFLSKGPVSFADTRFKGSSWKYDCHAVMVMPLQMISETTLGEVKMTVLFPDWDQKTVVNYLTFCYSGRYVRYFCLQRKRDDHHTFSKTNRASRSLLLSLSKPNPNSNSI